MQQTSHKIDLMIIGAQKAGTTSLKDYLALHPEIITHHQVEFAYFIKDDLYNQPYSDYYRQSYGDQIRGDQKILAKHAHIYRNPKFIQRLYDHNPNCELVFIMRNPVDRAYSSYKMAAYRGWAADKPFEYVKEAIQNHRNGQKDVWYDIFIHLGMYADQLEQIFNIFPRTQVHIYLFESLKKEPETICNAIFELLGLNTNLELDYSQTSNATYEPKSPLLTKALQTLRKEQNPLKQFAKKVLPYSVFRDWSQKVQNLNRGAKKQNQQLSPELRTYLQEYYQPQIERLQQLLEIDLRHWMK